PQEPPAPKPSPQTATPAVPPAAPAAPAAPVTRRPAAPRSPQRLATVETPLYRAVVSSEGGKLQELVLRYRGEKPMVILGDLGPAGLQLSPDGNGPGEVVSMSFDKDALVLTDKPAELALTGEADGLKIRLMLRFQPDGYAIDAHVRVANPGVTPRTVAVG